MPQQWNTPSGATATAATRPRLLIAVLGVAICLAGGAAAEQDATTLPEIVVTAELRNTPLLLQPSSTSVIDAVAIRERAAEHLEEVLALAPNVNLAGGSSRARYYQVRGIGERSQFVEPLNPSVGILIDNIDFSGLGGAGLLFDVEQVEILRGPQGTLHGANALAGLISIRTAEPASEPAAYVQATVADYGTRSLGASVTGPVIADTLLYRLALNQHISDGYLDNDFLNRSDTNERDELNARGKLRWLPDELNTVDLTLIGSDVDNGYDAFSLDNTRSTLSDEPGRDTLRTAAAALQWHHEATSWRSEVSLTAANTNTLYSFDEDWSFVGIAPDLEYSSTDSYERKRDSLSAQLRLVSTQPISVAGLSADWVAGAYYLRDEEALRREYTYLAQDFTSAFETTTRALFGQIDTQLSDRWVLSTGLRLADRQMDYRDGNGVDASPEKTLWGGKITLQFSPGNDHLLYASLSRGYRANGVNASILASAGLTGVDSPADALAARAFFDEELLINAELGHKASLLEGRLSSRLALFFMDRQDQQVRGSLAIPRADGSTAFIDYTDNAAAGTNFGLEWEVDWQPTARLTLFASVGLLDASFDDYTNADGEDLSGRDQAHAPRYQFAGGAEYALPGGWYLRGELEGKDAFYFSDRHAVRSDAYTLGHLRIGYRQDSWSVALWARNVADEDYYIRGFGSFGNDPRKGYALEPYLQYGEPRRVGVSADYRF